MDRARDTYRGESKTDAQDAYVIADQASMRGDLSELQANEGELAELQLLISRRRDLVTDRSRTITRLREALLALFPALERTLDLNNSSALTLVAHYQTPTALRRAGYKRVATYLKNRGIKGADTLAKKALAAAESQSAVLPAQDVASAIVAELARQALVLKQRIERVDEELKHRFSSARRRRSSLACRGWVRSSGPSLWWLQETSVPSLALTNSPPTPG